jgi:transposase
MPLQESTPSITEPFTVMPTYVGIDIAKETFEAALPHEGGYRTRSFSNSPEGFEELEALLPKGATCVMEASGPYGFRLAAYLYARSLPVCVVNPLSTSSYARMLLQRTKTDRTDAVLIASFADKMNPQPWQPPEESIDELKQRQTARDQLIKQRTQLRNAIGSLEELPRPSRAATGALQKALSSLEKQIARLEEDIEAYMKVHWGELCRLLGTIKGIGKRTILELIVVTHGFTRFATAKQLVSYIGICPRIYQSGTSVRGKPRITKMGLAGARRTLYMAAFSACKYNEDCKRLYNRLVERGKPHKVARVAVAHKLIRQAFAVATSGVPYVSGHASKQFLTTT